MQDELKGRLHEVHLSMPCFEGCPAQLRHTLTALSIAGCAVTLPALGQLYLAAARVLPVEAAAASGRG